jgi:hypothetical protein
MQRNESEWVRLDVVARVLGVQEEDVELRGTPYGLPWKVVVGRVVVWLHALERKMWAIGEEVEHAA